MQAVILAAGKGTRMHPLTLDKPKPLIEVANKPVLEHNLDQMLGLIDEAIIIVGYKKDMIMNLFGNNYLGMKLTYVVQEEQLGTGHALMQAEDKIKGKFLVLNGDDLYSRKDIENVCKYDACLLVKMSEIFHQFKKNEKSLSTKNHPNPFKTGGSLESKNVSAFAAVIGQDGMVSDIVEKPKTFISDLINLGMYCFTPEIFDILKNLKKSERGEYEIPDAIRFLAKQNKMHYIEMSGFWIPVSHPWQIVEATGELLEDKGETTIKGRLGKEVVIEGLVDIGEGSEIKDGTLIKGNIVIGKNCKIGKNCVLSGFTAIGDGCIIEEGVELDNVIVGENGILESNCVVKDSVLGDKACLSKGVVVKNKIGN